MESEAQSNLVTWLAIRCWVSDRNGADVCMDPSVFQGLPWKSGQQQASSGLAGAQTGSAGQGCRCREQQSTAGVD